MFLEFLDTFGQRPTFVSLRETFGRRRRPVRVFVSHSHDDHLLASALIELLRAELDELSPAEIRCTSNGRYGARLGINFNGDLLTSISDCKAFYWLISPASVRCQYVQFEVGARWASTFNNERALIPLLAPGMDLTELTASPFGKYLATRLESAEDLPRLLQQSREWVFPDRPCAEDSPARNAAIGQFLERCREWKEHRRAVPPAIHDPIGQGLDKVSRGAGQVIDGGLELVGGGLGAAGFVAGEVVKTGGNAVNGALQLGGAVAGEIDKAIQLGGKLAGDGAQFAGKFIDNPIHEVGTALDGAKNEAKKWFPFLPF